MVDGNGKKGSGEIMQIDVEYFEYNEEQVTDVPVSITIEGVKFIVDGVASCHYPLFEEEEKISAVKRVVRKLKELGRPNKIIDQEPVCQNKGERPWDKKIKKLNESQKKHRYSFMWHSVMRAKERYGLTLTLANVQAISDLIKEQKGLFLKRKSINITIWDVRFRDTLMRVVYDKRLGIIRTVLPMDSGDEKENEYVDTGGNINTMRDAFDADTLIKIGCNQ